MVRLLEQTTESYLIYDIAGIMCIFSKENTVIN